MVISRRLPFVVGKFFSEIDAPVVSHASGIPRPTINEPSAAWATSESSSTLLAFAMPHACGDDPRPRRGWFPTQGEAVDGAETLSHHEYGPLCVCVTMNS